MGIAPHAVVVGTSSIRVPEKSKEQRQYIALDTLHRGLNKAPHGVAIIAPSIRILATSHKMQQALQLLLSDGDADTALFVPLIAVTKCCLEPVRCSLINEVWSYP